MFVQIADSLSNIGRLWAAEADVGTARRPHESSLERIAGEISVLSATCDRAPQECAFIKQSRAQLDKEQARLLHEACAVLRRGIGEREQGAVESSLRAFAAVGQEVVAHRLFREEFASPAVADAVDAAKRDDGALAVEQVYAAVDEFLARESTCCLLRAAAGLRSSSAPQAAMRVRIMASWAPSGHPRARWATADTRAAATTTWCACGGTGSSNGAE